MVRCLPKLYAPAGGSLQCTIGNQYGSECSFACHEGHTISGSGRRVCEKDPVTSRGFWTGNATKCKGMQKKTIFEIMPDLPIPQDNNNNETGIKTNTHNVFNFQIYFTCTSYGVRVESVITYFHIVIIYYHFRATVKGKLFFRVVTRLKHSSLSSQAVAFEALTRQILIVPPQIAPD